MSKPTSQYVKILISATALCLLLSISINLLMDPFGIYEIVNVKGVNHNKLKVTPLTHVYALKNAHPKTLLIGGSRSAYFDPDHPVFKSEMKPVYVLSIDGGNLFSSFRNIEFANKHHKVKNMVILIDMWGFDVKNKGNSEFDENRLKKDYKLGLFSSLYIKDLVDTLFSLDALLLSSRTFNFNVNDPDRPKVTRVKSPYDVGKKFNTITKFLMSSDESQFTGRPHQFDFNGKEETFNYFRGILKIAYEQDIDLHMVIPPSHARYWELMYCMGLWPSLENWKKLVVEINETEAQKYGKKPLPILDFSGYTEFTTEKVPSPGEITNMNWHSEAIHYTPDLGDVILERIWGAPSEKKLASQKLGISLNSKNILKHLEKIRMDQVAYRNEEPAEFQIIKKISQETNHPTCAKLMP